jgi:hypothetical protein
MILLTGNSVIKMEIYSYKIKINSLNHIDLREIMAILFNRSIINHFKNNNQNNNWKLIIVIFPLKKRIFKLLKILCKKEILIKI